VSRRASFGAPPDSKEEFLDKLDKFYDTEYARMYEHYHKKGQAMIVRVKPRENFLCRYCEKQDKAWKEYKSFSMPIRTYRNRVVHDVQLGVVLIGKIHLIPRIEKIQKYTAMTSIHEALRRPEVLKRIL
jgi:hypothetical protein